MGYYDVLETLTRRVAEPAPGRVQLVTGPRQVGKTTLLLALQAQWEAQALFLAADAPEAALPGWWELQWAQAARMSARGPVLVLIDEIHYLTDWARLLKAQVDRLLRERLPIHVVVTGSAALPLGAGARETMAGRFERLTIPHWPARDLARAFQLSPDDAAVTQVRFGGFPGAMAFLNDLPRWRAYVRDSIIDPALGRDLLTVEAVRKPALLRQVFAVCVGHPAEILALNKIAGELQEPGALQTIAHYLELLHDAYLVAGARKFARNEVRRRASPSKVVPLTNAFLAARAVGDPPTRDADPSQWGRWVENACLAALVNAGQTLHYWREDPYEVDAVTEGDWGQWAIEIKTGHVTLRDLQGLTLFAARHPDVRPLLICDDLSAPTARQAGIDTLPWQQFLWDGVESLTG